MLEQGAVFLNEREQIKVRSLGVLRTKLNGASSNIFY